MEKTWLGSKLKVPDRTSNPSRGMTPGVQFVEETNMDLEKAPDDGIYVLGEGRFQVNKGDSIPEDSIQRNRKNGTSELRAPKAIPTKRRLAKALRKQKARLVVRQRQRLKRPETRRSSS
jgi:hypothetical protein